METSKNVIITKHAYIRMRERNGWNRKAATRMAGRIYSDGVRPDEVDGYLRDWVRLRAGYLENSEEYILYGERLYIFKNMSLITVLIAPSSNYMRYKTEKAIKTTSFRRIRDF